MGVAGWEGGGGGEGCCNIQTSAISEQSYGPLLYVININLKKIKVLNPVVDSLQRTSTVNYTLSSIWQMVCEPFE